MLIQVDVDSTLYDADKLFSQVAAEFGVKWKDRAPSWFGPEDIGTDLQTLKKIFRRSHSREYVMEQKPYPNAARVLAALSDTFDNIEIAYVSDRNVQQSAALREWLEANDFLHNEDQFVAATKDKREWMREKKPDIVIDDRVRTLLMAVFELGAYGLTLEHAHNINLKREVTGVYHAKNWNELEPILEHVVQKVENKIKP